MKKGIVVVDVYTQDKLEGASPPPPPAWYFFMKVHQMWQVILQSVMYMYVMTLTNWILVSFSLRS